MMKKNWGIKASTRAEKERKKRPVERFEPRRARNKFIVEKQLVPKK